MDGKKWKDFSGGNILNKYELERRGDNLEYAKALAKLTCEQKCTCHLATFVNYCKVFAISHPIIHEENLTWKKRSLKFKVRIMKQRGLVQLANYIKKKGDIVFYGTGCCRGKGHSTVCSCKIANKNSR